MTSTIQAINSAPTMLNSRSHQNEPVTTVSPVGRVYLGGSLLIVADWFGGLVLE